MSKSPKYLVRCSNINKKSDITGGPFRGRYHLSEDGAPESKESKTASCFAVHHGDRGPTIGHVGTVMVNPSGDSEKIIGQIPSTISAASVNISRDTAQQDSSDSVKVSLTDTDGKPVEDYLYHLKKYRSINARNYIIGHLNINSIRPSGPSAGSSQRLSSGPGATGPRVAVIGTSLVRGIGSRLNRRGMDAMTYTFPGYEVPLITERVSDLLTRNYQP